MPPPLPSAGPLETPNVNEKLKKLVSVSRLKRNVSVNEQSVYVRDPSGPHRPPPLRLLPLELKVVVDDSSSPPGLSRSLLRPPLPLLPLLRLLLLLLLLLEPSLLPPLLLLVLPLPPAAGPLEGRQLPLPLRPLLRRALRLPSPVSRLVVGERGRPLEKPLVVPLPHRTRLPLRLVDTGLPLEGDQLLSVLYAGRLG